MLITIPEKQYTLVGLYDLVATTMGLDAEECKYDCRKIEVAQNIQNNIYLYYEAEYADYPKDDVDFEITCMLALSGPKVNKALKDNQVEIYEGFIVNEK